ncbi:pyridoxal phosphate-dependent transferase [Parasitella parasitica]|nr:pyridoxal phosphate-dependent transferase [Parasitella parasitica]
MFSSAFLKRPVTCCRLGQSTTRSIATLPKATTEITHPDNQVPQSSFDTIDRLKKYTLALYNRPNIVFEYGKGCFLYDANDRAYLDFTAGIAVNALGHADPQVAKDLYNQAQKLVHTSNLYHTTQSSLLAEKLVETTNLYSKKEWANKVFLCNSGTEANEAALKFARKWGKMVGGENKTKLVCFQNAFHGRSMGALSVTPNKKYQHPYAPLVPDVSVLPFNNVYEILHEVDERTAGVIVEPIQGEGGVHVADEEFIKVLRERCTQTNSLLIFDEIQCGLGRTGKMWAHQFYNDSCTPDILTMAKPLANGVPIGALMTTDKVVEAIKIVTHVRDHGTTFGGNPLAAAVALGVLDRITSPHFLRKIDETSHALVRDLKALQDEYPEIIKEVRGEGLLLGVEFFEDPEPMIKFARERGLLLVTAGNSTIRIIPPLILTKAEAREGVARFSGAIEKFASLKK